MHEHQFEAGVPFGPATERARDIVLEADRRIAEEIDKVGGMEAYAALHPELKDSFTNERPFLCCMDERTARGTIHVPGSGILLEGPQAQAEFVQRLKDAGVEGIYSHDKCGAAKAYADKHGIDDYDAAAIAYSKDLAMQLGVEYKGHLKTSGEHPGRVVYYDATGHVDTGSRLWQEKMPTGFTVSRNVLDRKEAREALVLAVKIAFGHHGYGPEFFSDKDPLQLIWIADPLASDVSSDDLRRELEKSYEEIFAAVPEAKGKIRIDGFTAPAREEEEQKERIAA